MHFFFWLENVNFIGIHISRIYYFLGIWFVVFFSVFLNALVAKTAVGRLPARPLVELPLYKERHCTVYYGQCVGRWSKERRPLTVAFRLHRSSLVLSGQKKPWALSGLTIWRVQYPWVWIRWRSFESFIIFSYLLLRYFRFGFCSVPCL